MQYMAYTGEKIEKKILDWIRFAFLVFLIVVLTFQEFIEHAVYSGIYGLQTVLALAGLAAFVLLALERKNFRKAALIAAVCVLAFSLAGLKGYTVFHYQAADVTRQGYFDTLRFWLLVSTYTALFLDFPLKKFARLLSIPVTLCAAVIIYYTIADMLWGIWPRQVFRWGIGSIQLFYNHPSVFAARCMLILVLLILLFPCGIHCRIAAAAMFFPLFMTLRIRIWALLAAVAVLVLLSAVFKRKPDWKIGIPAAAVLAVIGGRRFYAYYLSPWRMTRARAQFVVNGFRIAKENFPFGTGFSTFGSRQAQIWYSPVYYWYDMMSVPGLDPLWPSYACDTFWPMILGETGWLGLIAYIGLVALLFMGVWKLRSVGKWVGVAAVCAFLYEMAESTGALAFSDETAVGIALFFGLLFGSFLLGNRKEEGPVPERTGGAE